MKIIQEGTTTHYSPKAVLAAAEGLRDQPDGTTVWLDNTKHSLVFEVVALKKLAEWEGKAGKFVLCTLRESREHRSGRFACLIEL
ncbi:MAG TPA: hypothetical protein VNP04_15600 [Alphaproteobacteria bacterium]|nr:hypothetical protein [Alphaproteobacteria bacterium]